MVYYRNANPGGAEMLRPLVKNQEKDTAQNVVQSIKKMEEDIQNLKETVVKENGKTVKIKHTVIQSMHDGKNR